ncbi:MAG TPA: GWxTD domain-containing protein [Bacteroidota bacterium]|nr:GWxTD domain-containing protein [Bacteroidota bacterium]
MKTLHHHIVIFRQRLISVLVSFLTMFFIVPTKSSTKADTVMVLADSLVRWGQFAQARDLYEAVSKDDRGYVAAQVALGRMLMTEGRYNLARDKFGDILDIDSASIEAHFYNGVCNREAARPVFWVMKYPYWNRATTNFEWVLAHDSLYKDVLYQYALLLLQKKERVRGFELATRQASLKPNDVTAQTDLFTFYRLVLDDLSESEGRDLLASRRSDIARYFEGEMARRKGDLPAADSLFQSMLDRPLEIPRQPVELSLCRVLFTENHPDSGESWYWRAVSEIRSPVDAQFLFEDLKYCITMRELLLYHSLTTPAQFKAFFIAFWTARNPTPAAAFNPRIAEHYHRLVYAEENFRCNIFRQSLARADVPIQDPILYFLNQEFDDRGLLYVRLGAPDQKIRTDLSPTNTYESWMYHETSQTPKLIFDFHCLSIEYNEWRLAPVQWDRQFLEDRVTWDAAYADLLMAMNRNAQSLEAARLEDKARKFTEQNLTDGLEMDRHTWEDKIDPLQIAAAITTFRGEANKTLVDISYSVPVNEIAAKMGKASEEVKLEIGVALTNDQSLPVWKRTDTLGLAVGRNSTGAIVDLYRFYAPPDSYNVSLQIHPIGLNLLGDWRSRSTIRSYSQKDFEVSDIQFLLPSPSKNRYQIEGIKVVPSPFTRYPVDQPLRIYIQAYNLTPGDHNRSSFTFESRIDRVNVSEGFFRKLTGLFRGSSKESLETKFSREADSSSVSQYLPLALGDFDPGEYVLTVKITDNHSKKSISRTRRFELFRREDYR